MSVNQLVAMKHLLVMRGRLRVRHHGIQFPADHLEIYNAASELVRLLPSNPLVIAELFLTGLNDRDPEDVHYSCRALLHLSNPVIGIPLSYALSFDRDSDWREYTTRIDLTELSSRGGPIAALCVTRLAEILCSDPDIGVVELAAEVIDDAIRNVRPSLNQIDTKVFCGEVPNTREGILEHLVEHSLSRPGAVIKGDITANPSAMSVKECLRYSIVALNGRDVAERCNASRSLLQIGWEVGLYSLASLYAQILNPQWAASRSPVPLALINVSNTDAARVGHLLAQFNIGIKLMIDGLQKAQARIITWDRGESAALDEELIYQTKQIVQEVPELDEALRHLC